MTDTVLGFALSLACHFEREPPPAHNRSVLGALCEALCEALCSLLLAGAAERDSLKAGVTRLVRP
jgi:hypothetical protein